MQRLVHELRRITLLWDEFWLGTLNQYHVDFGRLVSGTRHKSFITANVSKQLRLFYSLRRISQLEKEIGKVKNNSSLTMAEKSSLIVKKHNTFLKPVIIKMIGNSYVKRNC